MELSLQVGSASLLPSPPPLSRPGLRPQLSISVGAPCSSRSQCCWDDVGAPALLISPSPFTFFCAAHLWPPPCGRGTQVCLRVLQQIEHPEVTLDTCRSSLPLFCGRVAALSHRGALQVLHTHTLAHFTVTSHLSWHLGQASSTSKPPDHSRLARCILPVLS